jgi:hypothetical protein
VDAPQLALSSTDACPASAPSIRTWFMRTISLHSDSSIQDEAIGCRHELYENIIWIVNDKFDSLSIVHRRLPARRAKVPHIAFVLFMLQT